MESSTFHRGGVARLRSPPIWEQGPLCVHFAYHMFGLSWGAQLRLLLLRDSKEKHPSVLWKHINTQSPSWMPTAVTVPMGLVLPSQVMFEGVRGSTAYLDISLDAISIHRGSCNRVCMMQTCSFDIPNDLCGWSWIPTASGAKWVQKKGPSGVPNVGPEDDFSSPGSGFYMLLDPKNAKPRQKSVLLSPRSHSSGCLSLSFHYILRGQSPGAALTVSASVLGSIRKHTLFSGQPGPNWQPVSVNYTAQGQIQFTLVGVFGETPEPAVAVDAISTAPCGESFPQCDFEDDAHPFCDWAQASGDGGHWTRANKTMHIQGTGASGGRYIYIEADKFSEAGQSSRLVSRPFCAPGAICVEFAYHMYGLGEGAKLNLLLESPAGSSPSTIWQRVGSQSPDWLNTSVTIPLGHQQPMQLILEAIRGTNTAFVVAVDFILINHETCRGTVPTELPSKSPVPSPGPSEIPVSTGKPMTPTEKTVATTEKPMHSLENYTSPSEIATVPTERPMPPPEKHTVPNEIATVPTENTMAPTEKPTVLSEIATISTKNPMVPSEMSTVSPERSTFPPEQSTFPTEKLTIPTQKPTIPTEEPTIPTEKPIVPSEETTVPPGESTVFTGESTIPTEESTISTEESDVPIEENSLSLEEPTISTEESTVPIEESTAPPEEPTVSTEKPTVHTERTTISTERTTISTERTTIPTEEPTIPAEKPTVHTAGTTIHTTIPIEKPTMPTEKPIVHTEKPMVPMEGTTVTTERPTVPTEKPTIATEETTIPTEKPTMPTEKPVVHTEKPMVPVEGTTVTTERPTVPTEKPTITTEETTIPTEKPTMPTEKLIMSTEKPTILTAKLTIPTERSTVPTEKLTVSTAKPTILTEEPTIPTEKLTVPTTRPTIPTKRSTEKTTIPTEKPTISTEETTVPTEKPTAPTKKTTIPTEKPTVLTKETTMPTEKPIVPIEKTTIPAERPTIPTEETTESTETCTIPTEETTESTGTCTIPTLEPTIPTEKTTMPTENSSVPTKRPTIPTEKPTVPTENITNPTEKPIIPTEKPTIPTETPTVSTKKTTIPTEKPTVPTEKTTIPTEKPTVPTEKTTIPTENPTVPTEKPIPLTKKTTIPTEKTTIPTENPTVPTEKTTIPTEKPTVRTEKTTIPTEKPTVPTEKPTAPTKKTTIPTEKTTIPTEKPTIPTEKTTIPTEKPTIPSEKTTIPTEKPTAPTKKTTEKPTIPTEKTTIPTEKPTVPTEKPTAPTKKTTIPTEKPTIPTEASTVPTEKPTASTKKTTIPTEKSTVPTKKPTTPTTPQPRPTLVPIRPTVLVMPPTTTPSTSMTSTTPGHTPARCPPNAHYEPCACPASCERPKPICGPLCKPGCVCSSGFLFHESRCINASSCNCFYNNNYYKPGAEWFSSNCTERCRCRPGKRMECNFSQCGPHTVCQLKNGQYGCQPYGTATCTVYGDPHQITFDGRHFSFMGKCTYILAQPCGNSTEPFFRVVAKNEGRGQESMSILSKIYVMLPKVTITLLGGRRVLVGSRQVTLPAIASKGVFLALSGRFVELQTVFGLLVKWDGDQQLYLSVPSTYSRKLCGFCGNYDGDSSNDNRKPDGSPAQDMEELGNSWQTEDKDKECQKNPANPPSCNQNFLNSLSALQFCGRLMDARGTFEACLPHLKASLFFKNCVSDMCKFQRLESGLCTHMAALTEICQDAGYTVKPWRRPQFCPLTCPPNSRYRLCAPRCPATCFPSFLGMSCKNRCVEGCECNPGFVLSGLQCIPQSQCGCLEPTVGYFKIGEQWFKPGCQQHCTCESNNRVRCVQWRCQAQEVCRQQDGIYSCHARGAATCSVSGDPHYLTFDGALTHVTGTCTYVLTQLCQSSSLESHFAVSTTHEFRGGNLEAAYVRAVHVQVFNLRISLVKGHKVVLNGRRVALPLWPAQGRVSIRPSGSFILLYTDFGLQVRYDGSHLVEVTVPSSYSGRLCGLCGNYNNNSLDDSLLPNKTLVAGSDHLGVAWKLPEYSEPGCFVEGAKPSRCLGDKEADIWKKNCDILTNPLGPFSRCHAVVPPQSSFASCVYGQCGTKGDTLALCRSLQAYASLCSHAGQALTWRNSTFCPLKCSPGSSYHPCANPCPATCLSRNTARDCPMELPCTEGCECRQGHVLSGTSCVPFSQCGCVHQDGSYHPVGESWYPDNTCSRLCTCSTHSNISCRQSTCKPGQLCRPLDGLLRCRTSGVGVCRTSDRSPYVTFDGMLHTIQNTCTYVLLKVCHSTLDLPFFKISGKHGKRRGRSAAFYLYRLHIDISDTRVTLGEGHRVLINGTQATLPSTRQIRGVKITASGVYTVLSVNIGLQVKFDGKGFLEVQLPAAYYQKVCGLCGNFNDEDEDELMMPSEELAQNDTELVDSWQDRESDPKCQPDDQTVQAEMKEKSDTKCRLADLVRAQERCQTALRAPAWAKCASHVVLGPFLLNCTNSLCQGGGRLSRALCESLETFGAACRAKGLNPPIWRNSSFCPLECPAHSSYSTCLPSCPPSCLDLTGQCSGPKVPSTCKEGCLCLPGYVLSGQRCVTRSQCGCINDYGSSFPEGKTWISIRCTRSCVCTLGTIHCQPFSCPPGSHCESKAGGTGSCEINKSDQCSIYGDPHYRTFDGLSYLFRGRMTYTLIKAIGVLPAGVVPLVVEGRNKVYSSWSPIYLHEIIVMVYGYTVQLKAHLELVVNNQRTAIPYKPSDRLQVTLRGHRLYLITDFEMVVTFDGGKNAVITLPNKYKGLVRGLCGNFDGSKSNDFILPNGTITQNLVTFGNSWEVQRITGVNLARFSRAIQEEEEEEKKESGFHVSECSPEQLELINSTQACRVLGDPQGPFAACHQTVAPEPFQEHCVFDLCAARNPREQEELRCQVLSGYAIICQEAGAALASWRDHTRCALACPANTVYRSCMTPCPASCAHLVAPKDCKGPCVEGCASLPGYVYSGAQSLPLAHCGCTSNGVYYQRGDSFVTEDCSQRCTCARSGALLCEPLSCRAGEICTLANLTRGCFRESPCLQNPCQNDGRCWEQGTHFTCECELGYGGHLCTEPWDGPAPGKPEASNFVAILLGMLVPVVVLVPAVTRGCLSRKGRRRREKVWNQNRARLADAGENHSCPSTLATGSRVCF
ncbi:zonadhesin isoform X2 [Mustela lutreola]|uniref:zonadhesin isoform X2 n=1 Tax=Mustela lutreola TaxID=9666 RepID=UPI002797AA52|nr:zonadhesin isoform X2 [Mustela lutreola]